MSIFSGLSHSRDKSKDKMAVSSYRFMFGGTTSGKPVNERSVMQMTAVYSCVRILAEAVAGLPLHVYRYGANSSKEKAIAPHCIGCPTMSRTRRYLLPEVK